ncbi:MAG: hypothetical protein ACTSVB_08510 [Candidatus Heimdallarchaeaceae archaeon]
MVGGPVIVIHGGNWEWDSFDYDVVEDFSELELYDKYGCEIGWFHIDNKIHIVWRYLSGVESNIHLYDNLHEAGKAFKELLLELLDIRSIDEEDENKMLKVVENI